MKVTIYTLFDDVVIELIKNAHLLDTANDADNIARGGGMVIGYRNDDLKQEWREWIAAALNCGLIEGGYIR